MNYQQFLNAVQNLQSGTVFTVADVVQGTAGTAVISIGQQFHNSYMNYDVIYIGKNPQNAHVYQKK